MDTGAVPGAGTANVGARDGKTLIEQEDEQEQGLSSATSAVTQQALDRRAEPGAVTTNGGAEYGTEEAEEGGGKTRQGQVSAAPTPVLHTVDTGASPGAGTANGDVGGGGGGSGTRKRMSRSRGCLL